MLCCSWVTARCYGPPDVYQCYRETRLFHCQERSHTWRSTHGLVAPDGSSTHPEHNLNGWNARYSTVPLLSRCLYQVLSLFFCVFIFVFIFRSWPLTPVSFSLLPSSIRVVLTLSLIVFPYAAKNQREADKKNAWNLSTISPLHLCGVKLMQMNFLKQNWQFRYNVILRCVRVMSILPRL